MKANTDLGDIQKTLLLPLWGRAVESKKREPILIDKTAIEIMEQIEYDFNAFEGLSQISQFGWVVRSMIIDEVIRQFILKYPKATIVDIGCGLDTTFDRIDNGSIRWYDLDLPDTIELRRRFFKESERRKFISSSFLDPDWINTLIVDDNILFISAGVFYYFEKEQIKRFFERVADKFPGSEMVFDASSPFGVKMANRMVIKNSGMDERSFLTWGIKRSEDLGSWDNRIEILREMPFFKNIRKRLPYKTRIQLFFSDMFRMQYMIHLKFKE